MEANPDPLIESPVEQRTPVLDAEGDSSRLPDRRRGVPHGRIHGQARRWPDRGMDFRGQGQFMEETPRRYSAPKSFTKVGAQQRSTRGPTRWKHRRGRMLLFYGWKDKDLPEASAFLLHE